MGDGVVAATFLAVSSKHGAMINASINGERREFAAGTTVEALVLAIHDRGVGLAVALNGEVLPRGSWAKTTLSPEDRLEVLTAAPGG